MVLPPSGGLPKVLFCPFLRKQDQTGVFVVQGGIRRTWNFKENFWHMVSAASESVCSEGASIVSEQGPCTELNYDIQINML